MENLQLPPRVTQTQLLKTHLVAGKTISTWQAYELYHITCLAQCIHRLRKKGLPIDSKIVTHEDKRFSEYWLNTDYLKRHRIVDPQSIQGGQ